MRIIVLATGDFTFVFYVSGSLVLINRVIYYLLPLQIKYLCLFNIQCIHFSIARRKQTYHTKRKKTCWWRYLSFYRGRTIIAFIYLKENSIIFKNACKFANEDASFNIQTSALDNKCNTLSWWDSVEYCQAMVLYWNLEKAAFSWILSM